MPANASQQIRSEVRDLNKALEIIREHRVEAAKPAIKLAIRNRERVLNAIERIRSVNKKPKKDRSGTAARPAKK